MRTHQLLPESSKRGIILKSIFLAVYQVDRRTAETYENEVAQACSPGPETQFALQASNPHGSDVRQNQKSSDVHRSKPNRRKSENNPVNAKSENLGWNSVLGFLEYLISYSQISATVKVW